LTLTLALLASCGDAGVEAYREGRFRDAHEAFSEAEGDDTPAELSFNRALAALRVGDLSDAEEAAERAGARGGPEIAALSLFLRGNAAFARCEMAERQARTAAAEPFAFDVALTYARKAARLWRTAAATRPDWPEARRNVERALLKLEQLKRQKAEAGERKRRKTDPGPGPRPPRPRPPDPTVEEDPTLQAQTRVLTPDEVARLIERLGEKEREKLALRRTHRERQRTGIEKDW
jgi:tetratricopeptide (TPR) repeat protein